MSEPCVGSDRRWGWVSVKVLAKDLGCSTLETMRFQRYDNKEKKAKSSERGKWPENMAVCIRLTKFLAGEGRNKRMDPRFSRRGSCPCAQGENDRMDLEMEAGLLKSRLACGGCSSGMVGRAYLWLADLFESSTAASSPSHSFFEADRPDWVYQWKMLTSHRRSSIAILNWGPVARLQPGLSLCLQSLIQNS